MFPITTLLLSEQCDRIHKLFSSGEMRDMHEIEMALKLAETGHLVFSTLHTRSAYQTISRIIDAFPAGQQNQIRLQLADTLVAAFSQRS